jgi:hypothetical protein
MEKSKNPVILNRGIVMERCFLFGPPRGYITGSQAAEIELRESLETADEDD